MMKKSISFVLISSLLMSMQPIMAQEEAPPSAWLARFRSLPKKKLTRPTLQEFKEYVNSKYRCIRHGEGCSWKQRAVLTTLSFLVTAAAAAGTAWTATRLGEKGEPELLRAVWLGNADEVKDLLDAGANVNSKDENGDTALIVASRDGYTEIVEMLLKAEANVDIKNNKGNTALMQAAGWNQPRVVEILLKAGANVDIKNNNGFTALVRAQLNDRQDIINMLQAAGAKQ
jgi:hypothetical protein